MTYRYHFVHTLYYSLVRIEVYASAGQSCRIPRSTLAEGTVGAHDSRALALFGKSSSARWPDQGFD